MRRGSGATCRRSAPCGNPDSVLAIIGGSGLAKLANLKNTRRKSVRTPYGSPSARLTFGRIGGREIAFLARHGDGHSIAPHEVNYRANLWALKKAGAREVVSVATVGGISSAMVPGALVVPHQIIDYTWGRRSTYFEGKGRRGQHHHFTQPYLRAPPGKGGPPPQAPRPAFRRSRAHLPPPRAARGARAP